MNMLVLLAALLLLLTAFPLPRLGGMEHTPTVAFGNSSSILWIAFEALTMQLLAITIVLSDIICSMLHYHRGDMCQI